MPPGTPVGLGSAGRSGLYSHSGRLSPKIQRAITSFKTAWIKAGRWHDNQDTRSPALATSPEGAILGIPAMPNRKRPAWSCLAVSLTRQDVRFDSHMTCPV